MLGDRPDSAGQPRQAVDYNALPPPPNPGEQMHKKKKKPKEDMMKKAEITINSLLDCLSVILVFLLKSYQTSNIQVKPSAELQIPFTQSAKFADDSTAITVTQRRILMNDHQVVTLDNGELSQADLSGDFLIEPLLRRLQEEVQHLRRIAQFNKKAQFNGVVTIIGDRYVPASLLVKIMYTSGQAEYSKFKFLAVKTERSDGGGK